MKYLVIIFFLPILVKGQDADSFNFDSIKKHSTDGYHTVINKDSMKIEFYTKNGKLNGYEKCYSKNGELVNFGEWKNDTMVGNSFMFEENGKIICAEENISINNIVIDSGTNLEDYGHILNKYKPMYISYIKFYNEDGTLAEEGIILYSDNPITEGVEYGKWKYYEHGIYKYEKYRNINLKPK